MEDLIKNYNETYSLLNKTIMEIGQMFAAYENIKNSAIGEEYKKELEKELKEKVIIYNKLKEKLNNIENQIKGV